MLKVNKAGSLLLAIDGGGTKTRCAAYTLDGVKLAAFESGPSNHLSKERTRVLDSLRIALSSTLELCRVEIKDVALLSAGFAGVDFDGVGASEAEALLHEVGYEQTLINGDMVTAHAGALMGQPGIVAISGTGSVFFGTSPLGDRLKLGGFGYAFGDEGSGYWIATAALRAASKAFDRRGEATVLVDALCHAMKVADFSMVPRAIYTEGAGSLRIAELSCTVETIAEAGDQIAIGILAEAGVELAIGTGALIQRLDLSEGCTVSYYGAVLQRCSLVRERFKNELSLNFPSVKIVDPVHDALFGAYLLGKSVLEGKSKG